MNLEFYIKLREMVSGGLAKMAATAKKTTSAIKGSNDQLAMSYDTIKGKIRDLESVIGRSTSVKQIREARSELEKLQRISTKHAGNTSGGGGFLAGALRSVLPTLGLAGALTLGGSMLNSGLEAQARQASFEVMAGKEGGTRLNKNIGQFAQDSIYGNELYGQAQTMLGFGLKEKDIMPSLKMIGDIAMGDANKMQSLTLAFSQVSAAGKLTGSDLLQFINAGFNPLGEIARKTGKSIGALKKEVEEGKISFDMVRDAFTSATSAGGNFYNMTSKIAETDFGKLQAFQGQLEGLGMKIGGMLAPILGSLISNVLVPLANALSVAVDWIQQNSEWLQVLAGVVGVAAIGYYAYTFAVSGVTIATNLWAAAQRILNLVMSMNPIGIVIALIAGLVAGIMIAWNKFEGFRKVVWGLWEVFKQVFENIGGFFKKIFEPIFEAITAFKEGRYLDAAKSVGKMVFNLTPVGLAVAATNYAKDGGFTKGIGEAWQKGQERGKNKASVGATDAATPGGCALSYAISPGQAKTDDVAKGITGGGPRVININGLKFMDKMADNVHINGMGDLQDIEARLEEMLLRVLNSGAAVQ